MLSESTGFCLQRPVRRGRAGACLQPLMPARAARPGALSEWVQMENVVLEPQARLLLPGPGKGDAGGEEGPGPSIRRPGPTDRATPVLSHHRGQGESSPEGRGKRRLAGAAVGNHTVVPHGAQGPAAPAPSRAGPPQSRRAARAAMARDGVPLSRSLAGVLGTPHTPRLVDTQMYIFRALCSWGEPVLPGREPGKRFQGFCLASTAGTSQGSRPQGRGVLDALGPVISGTVRWGGTAVSQTRRLAARHPWDVPPDAAAGGDLEIEPYLAHKVSVKALRPPAQQLPGAWAGSVLPVDILCADVQPQASTESTATEGPARESSAQGPTGVPGLNPTTAVLQTSTGLTDLPSCAPSPLCSPQALPSAPQPSGHHASTSSFQPAPPYCPARDGTDPQPQQLLPTVGPPGRAVPVVRGPTATATRSTSLYLPTSLTVALAHGQSPPRAQLPSPAAEGLGSRTPCLATMLGGFGPLPQILDFGLLPETAGVSEQLVFFSRWDTHSFTAGLIGGQRATPPSSSELRGASREHSHPLDDGSTQPQGSGTRHPPALPPETPPRVQSSSFPKNCAVAAPRCPRLAGRLPQDPASTCPHCRPHVPPCGPTASSAKPSRQPKAPCSGSSGSNHKVQKCSKAPAPALATACTCQGPRMWGSTTPRPRLSLNATFSWAGPRVPVGSPKKLSILPDRGASSGPRLPSPPTAVSAWARAHLRLSSSLGKLPQLTQFRTAGVSDRRRGLLPPVTAAADGPRGVWTRPDLQTPVVAQGRLVGRGLSSSAAAGLAAPLARSSAHSPAATPLATVLDPAQPHTILPGSGAGQPSPGRGGLRSEVRECGAGASPAPGTSDADVTDRWGQPDRKPAQRREGGAPGSSPSPLSTAGSSRVPGDTQQQAHLQPRHRRPSPSQKPNPALSPTCTLQGGLCPLSLPLRPGKCLAQTWELPGAPAVLGKRSQLHHEPSFGVQPPPPSLAPPLLPASTLDTFSLFTQHPEGPSAPKPDPPLSPCLQEKAASFSDLPEPHRPSPLASWTALQATPPCLWGLLTTARRHHTAAVHTLTPKSMGVFMETGPPDPLSPSAGLPTCSFLTGPSPSSPGLHGTSLPAQVSGLRLIPGEMCGLRPGLQDSSPPASSSKPTASQPPSSDSS
ncbi:proline-rich protein 36-like [Hyaena hyaena]|uniref:proline-rich protein 36-like n=1 Tax=Hyaena hyaena TaxID=95912 RepID=UPI00192422C0|nr:proline-rich protein 36-like [Hyaena hyaena]